MKRHYVYELRCIVNDMLYIGVRSCTCPPDEDIAYLSSSKYVAADVAIYGYSKFKKTILAEFMTREDAMKHEVELHAELNVDIDKNYYNRSKQKTHKFDTSSLFGPLSSRFGVPCSPETKEKIRIANTGKPSAFLGKQHTQETKDRIREHNLGKCYSDEVKEKHRMAIQGKRVGKDHPMYGKHHTEESKLKTSLVLACKQKSDEHRRKISVAMSGENHHLYGKKHTDTTRALISASLKLMQKRLWVTPLGTFDSSTKAAMVILCSASTVVRRCMTGMSGYGVVYLKTTPIKTFEGTDIFSSAGGSISVLRQSDE
jgi:predicted GIY-YIG superfamily endonuclease